MTQTTVIQNPISTLVAKQRFWMNPKQDWPYAACDNPNCPEFAEVKRRHNAGISNAGFPVTPSWQNGYCTLCETCANTFEVADNEEVQR